MKRSSGVLLHISSLPNDYGIGSFGRTAYEFIDFLAETGQTFWQILPLTTTSDGNSPYQSFSAFAGNTYFIDLDTLHQEGWLSEKDIKRYDFSTDLKKVDYAKVKESRRTLLMTAVGKFVAKERHQTEGFRQFVDTHSKWLVPFVEFMTVKEFLRFSPLHEWPAAFRRYDKQRVKDLCESHPKIVHYYLVTQFWFFQQWMRLKAYANKNRIQIIGDLPIYVSQDSVEVWQQPYLFKVDENSRPKSIAGVPPDHFSEEGQLWGNPVYDWGSMKDENYAWWIWRLRENFRIYDWVRIDHFKGFDKYWEVPYGSKNAVNGSFEKGPGIDLFEQIRKELGDLNVIVEDLGFITDEVVNMRDQMNFLGMKILQYGFNKKQEDSLHLPHHYQPHSVAYVGTHDNPTSRDWYDNYATLVEQEQANRYLHRKEDESISSALLRGIAASPSKIAIYTMQDMLGLGEEGRMNIPSTVGNNWDWRMQPGALTEKLRNDLKKLTQIYFRMNK